MEEFSRTRLLLGSEKLDALAGSSVLVFGVGGVGSHCIDALARSGVGRLILIDNDTVALSNLNRQSIAFHSTIGQYKTQIMKARIADINPQAQVETREVFVLPENLDSLLVKLAPFDYMIDAIDTISAKLAIAEYACSHNIPLISSMGTGNKLHGELFEFADIYDTSVCPLCRVMRRELKKRGVPRLRVLYSKEKPLAPAPDQPGETSRRQTPGSLSFVPPIAGILIAGEVIRSLAGV